jgi:hypothetical protein
VTTTLYTSGELFEWSNSERTIEGGKVTRRDAPWAWRLSARLTPKGIAAIKKLMADECKPSAEPYAARFAKTPPAGLGQDQGTICYVGWGAGRDYWVTRGAGATQLLPLAIQKITLWIGQSIIPGGATPTSIPSRRPLA